MADVTIVGIPDGAEEDVKRMAMVAIERFMTRRLQIYDQEKKKAFEDSVDLIHTNNNLNAKYTVVKREPLE